MITKYRYLVIGPEINPIQEVQRHKLEGYEAIVVSDGETLRGRACGEVVFVGDYHLRWNYQDILESVDRFKVRCQDEPEQQSDIARPDDFFDYGID